MRYAVAVLAAVVAGGAVSAQSAQTPTFKSTTALLVVDVSVLDAQGRPVPNLTANDFQVKLDGQVRPVRTVTPLGESSSCNAGSSASSFARARRARPSWAATQASGRRKPACGSK